MRYIFLQIFVLSLGVVFLLLLSQQRDFLPVNEQGIVNWYNVSSVLFFLFLVSQSTISLFLYFLQKFLTCGIKEFPSSRFSLKWGILISFLLTILLLLNIYHIVTLLWGVVIFFLIILLLIFAKI